MEAAFVGCGDEQGVLYGKYQLVYISPEALFQKSVWRWGSDIYGIYILVNLDIGPIFSA